jgi:hypothetical protein
MARRKARKNSIGNIRNVASMAVPFYGGAPFVDLGRKRRKSRSHSIFHSPGTYGKGKGI